MPGGGHGGYGRGGGYGQAYTVVVSDQSNFESPVLPVLTYEDGVQPNFINCLTAHMHYCHKKFSGESMNACMYGVLLKNDLLPGGVAGGVTDVGGGFMAAMALDTCSSISQTSDLIPRST